jgi:pyruvate dehydrogenase E1 component alpha subunit
LKCPTHLYIGQEAVAVGISAALRRTDVIYGGHRSHGHYLAKGGNLNSLMAEVFCRKDGCSGGRGGSMHLIDEAAGVGGTVPIVGATIPIAVGAAWAFQYQKKDSVVVSYFGDGASEEGQFYESLNYAANSKIPVIFVCENNLLSSHLHIRDRRVVSELSPIAASIGVPSVTVDGNDVFAVRDAAEIAVARARAGEGPTLIEAMTYRWRGHVGPAWDVGIGRTEAEIDEWVLKDPLAVVERNLVSRTPNLESEIIDIRKRIELEIEASVEFAMSSPSPDLEFAEKHVYGE